MYAFKTGGSNQVKPWNACRGVACDRTCNGFHVSETHTENLLSWPNIVLASEQGGYGGDINVWLGWDQRHYFSELLPLLRCRRDGIGHQQRRQLMHLRGHLDYPLIFTSAPGILLA